MADLHRRLEEMIRRPEKLGGRYQIGRRVGAGAYGMIFRGVDDETGVDLAVKAVPPQVRQRSDTAIGRFQREMKVIRSLDHPNIISLHDWGRTNDGIIYMVLEFIDGTTLDEAVHGEPLVKEMAIDVTSQIASALQTAHDAGVIHRDLKPANVMLEGDRWKGYHVKVLDFGMAKVLSPLGDESIVDLTREGMAVGTPRYIAPEQARGQTIGPQADIYALGLLLYEMLTGVQAVQADSVEGAVAAHVASGPLELPDADAIPPELHSVFWKMIAKDVDSRYPSARRVVEALKTPAEPIVADTGQAQIGPALGDVTGDFPTAGNHSSDGRQSDSSTSNHAPSSGRRERRERRVDMLREEEELELDTEAYEAVTKSGDDSDSGRAAPSAERKRRQSAANHASPQAVRVPRDPGEWLEAGLTVVTVPLAFLAIGAHAAGLDFGMRWAASAAVPIAIFGWCVASASADWNRSFGRRGWMVSVAVLVVAHLVDSQQLATELMRSPVWFVEPLNFIPGIGWLEDAVAAVSRRWARLIFDFL